jgi:hypothetical protein
MGDPEQPEQSDETGSESEHDSLFSPRLYLYIGGLSVLGAVFLIPIMGLIGVWSGYKLHQIYPKNIWSGIVIGAGGMQAVNWILVMLLM